MEHIRELLPADIPQVVHLHQHCGIGDVPGELNRLCDYYRVTFLESPWYDSAMPSLVCADDNGRILGFIGILSRRMQYNNTLLKVAVAHRFMVNSKEASPLLASRLMKRFLSGPQDLSLSDGANHQGKKFWLGCGGEISWLYSIDWFKPICPISYFATVASGKQHKWLRCLLPVCKGVDRCGCWLFRRTGTHAVADSKKEPLSPAALHECIHHLAGLKQLSPVYSPEELQWLYSFIEANSSRGQLQGYRINNTTGIIGCYLYYLRQDSIAEVMLLCASRGYEGLIYEHLLLELNEKGAIGAIGRMEPDFLPTFGHDKVMFKRGCWAMVHSHRSDVIETINSGKAFFSKLEGELCLYAPNHI